MSTLLFGGSFNPLHIGHLAIAEEVCWQLKLNTVVFLPSAQTPLKSDSTTPFNDTHRLAMLNNTLAPISWATICSYELDHKSTAPHYAIDMVRFLKKTGVLTQDTYYLLGDDWVDRFAQWKECDALCQETQLVLAQRDGNGKSFHYPHTLLNNQLLPISSNDIRLRIANNRPFRFLVPQEVYAYIKQHDLYQ
jgi:nicotinate-nucleotide adenylyltransferase